MTTGRRRRAERAGVDGGSAAAERMALRDRLLLAILPHVAFDGWTDRALAAGARDSGDSAVTVQRLFPGGIKDVVGHFGDWADRRMLDGLKAENIADLRLRERVALAVRLRLTALAPHREAVRRTLAWLALPPNAPLALRGLWRTVDAIWYAVGDRATDFGFYTKRGLLAGVISATTLYWLDDDSDGHAASWAFLDRRIADVMRIPALRARLGRFGDRLPNPFRILRGAHRR